jgi:hypothetical protein
MVLSIDTHTNIETIDLLQPMDHRQLRRISGPHNDNLPSRKMFQVFRQSLQLFKQSQ